MKKILLVLYMMTFAFSLVATESIEAYIVLQYYAGFRTDFTKIKKDLSQKLILVCFSGQGNELPEDQREAFDAIHSVDDMSDSTMERVLQPYITTCSAEKIRIVTNDEWALLPAARAREAFDIPGPSVELINKFRDKTVMKKMVSKAGLHVPKYFVFSPEKYRDAPHSYMANIAQTLSFPIFSKPIDGASSIGLSKINNMNELEEWMQAHTESDMTYELDEFIEGRLYHCDTLISNGKISFFSIGKQYKPCFYFLSGAPVATRILDESDFEYERLRKYNDEILRAFGEIPDGATHLELFITPDDKIVFIELAARVPGGLVPECYSKMYGFPFEEAAFRLQLGQEVSVPKEIQNYVGYFYFPKKKGVVTQAAEPSIESSCQCDLYVKPGEEIETDPSFVVDICSKLIFWNEDKDQLMRDYSHLIDHPPVLIN